MKKMKSKKTTVADENDILPEYDFSNGVRGKYAQRYREGVSSTVYDPNEKAVKSLTGKATTFMPIEADIVQVFPDSKAVNTALRHIIAAMPKPASSAGGRVKRKKAA